MSGASTIALADIFVALLAALAIVAIVSTRFAVPYTVALVVFGLLVALLRPDFHVTVTPELVLAILVPGLVFEAALSMDVEALRSNLPSVALLAMPGVLLVALITGLILSAATGMSYASAFLVGAITSATDPVAVIATMRHLHAPARLGNLVEAESLFNDGTAVVLFAVAVAGTSLFPHGLLTMAVTVVVSLAIGGVVGVVAAQLAARTDDVNLELTLTIICAYGTYLAADALHESGIIATVVAGIILGSYGRRIGLSARGRVAIDTVWSYLAFLLTAIVFLLVGLAITPAGLVSSLVVIGWAVLAVLLGRAIVVYGMLGLAGRTAPGRRLGMGMSPAWLHVIFWSGLRGAIAVALALSVPTDYPDRALLQDVVFGVVLFTLLVQGSTAGLILRRSGAMERDAGATVAPG
jgi:CPA1 family monovalent cation:H+ antiporter